MYKINNFKMTIFSLFLLGTMSCEARGTQCELNREACWKQCDDSYDDLQNDCQHAMATATITSRMRICLASRSEYCQPCQEQCDKIATGCGWNGQ